MREECSFWLEFFDDSEGFFEVEVRGVRFQADAIEHEHVEVAKAVHRIGWNRLQVGRVGEIIEAVRDDRQLSVYHLERRYLDLFADAERRIVNDRVRDQLRQAAAEMCRLKDVLENPSKIDPGDLVREDRHCSVAKIERANII